MKTSGMLIKYYFFSLLMVLLIGFNQYAFKIVIPFYVTSAVSIFILWGLIYSALKDCDAEYSSKNLRSSIIGVVLPNSIVLLVFSEDFGLTGFSSIVAALISVVIGGVIVWGLFTMSKGMLRSIPIDDDYDS